MLVPGEADEIGSRVGKIVGPVAEEMGRGGASVVVGTGRNALEEIGMDPTALLVEPEGLGQVMEKAEIVVFVIAV